MPPSKPRGASKKGTTKRFPKRAKRPAFPAPVNTKARALASSYASDAPVAQFALSRTLTARLNHASVRAPLAVSGRQWAKDRRVMKLNLKRGLATALVKDPTRAFSVSLTFPIMFTASVEGTEFWNACRPLRLKLAALAHAVENRKLAPVSEDLAKVLLGPQGLMPDLSKINFTCACTLSSGARLCPHAWAVLYAMAGALDDHPNWLFTLRGQEIAKGVDSLLRTQPVTSAVKRGKQPMKKPNPPVIPNNHTLPQAPIVDQRLNLSRQEMNDLFGIVLGTVPGKPAR